MCVIVEGKLDQNHGLQTCVSARISLIPANKDRPTIGEGISRGAEWRGEISALKFLSVRSYECGKNWLKHA